MASHSLPVPSERTQVRTRVQGSTPVLPIRTAIMVFSALLILFGWLHLILALQIASTDRQILEQSSVLDKAKRDKAAIMLQLAKAQSPEEMEKRAIRAKYRRQEPLYLFMAQSSVEHINAPAAESTSLAASIATENSQPQEESLLETFISELADWIKAQIVP